jgi:hypothetical protein
MSACRWKCASFTGAFSNHFACGIGNGGDGGDGGGGGGCSGSRGGRGGGG